MAQGIEAEHRIPFPTRSEDVSFTDSGIIKLFNDFLIIPLL